MRWPQKLSAYTYVIEHLHGERNVWADTLTRWAVSAGKLAFIIYSPITPSSSDELDWPDHSALMNNQKVQMKFMGEGLRRKMDLSRTGMVCYGFQTPMICSDFAS